MVRYLKRQFNRQILHGTVFDYILKAGLLVFIVSVGQLSFSDEESPSKPYAFRDFGYLPQKAEVSHTFHVYNTGSDSLRVTRIQSGCSCTSVSKIERPIPPGDSAVVKVTFKSGRYHHRVSKTTKVFTDDEVIPVRHLRITAYVFKKGEETGAVAVEPSVLKWKIEKETVNPLVDTLKVSNRSEGNLKIELEHYPGQLLEMAAIPDMLDPGESINLILKVSPGSIKEKTEGNSLTIAFIGADTSRVTVPIEIKD